MFPPNVWVGLAVIVLIIPTLSVIRPRPVDDQCSPLLPSLNVYFTLDTSHKSTLPHPLAVPVCPPPTVLFPGDSIHMFEGVMKGHGRQ